MRDPSCIDGLELFWWLVNLSEKSLFLFRVGCHGIVSRRFDYGVFLSDLRPVRDTCHCAMQTDQARTVILANKTRSAWRRPGCLFSLGRNDIRANCIRK
jgi:hypothetical protein